MRWSPYARRRAAGGRRCSPTFGETTEPCGNCDLCLEGVQSFDGTVEAQKLSRPSPAPASASAPSTSSTCSSATRPDAIQRFRHNQLKTFGVGKDRSKNEWRSLLRQIYAAGLVSLDIAEYGRWTITDRGDAVLRGQERIELRSDVLTKPADRRRRRSAAFQADAVVPSDDPLLLALKGLRTQLAKEEHVPAYVIFSDRSLLDMAANKPTTRTAFASIHGVGQAKLDRYADAFLAVLREHAA
jgi:ATP-dependent DNA helicase RecQ